MTALRITIVAAIALYLGHFALAALINGQITVEQAQGEMK